MLELTFLGVKSRSLAGINPSTSRTRALVRIVLIIAPHVLLISILISLLLLEHASLRLILFKHAVSGTAFKEDPECESYVYRDELLTNTTGFQSRMILKGTLSGKTIYCSAGHGYTYSGESEPEPQRPVSNLILEDAGNQEQLTIFANMALLAGATVVPMRPVGTQTLCRVVDNTHAANVIKSGKWFTSRSNCYYGSNSAEPYLFSKASFKATAAIQFIPDIQEEGFYPVYTWVRDGDDRMPQTFSVNTHNTSFDIVVDTRNVGKGWIYLGSYYFTKGTDGYVETTNKTESEIDVARGAIAIADAVRFGNGVHVAKNGRVVPLEHMNSVYWAGENGRNPPKALNFYSNEQINNVGFPSRNAAYMNRETRTKDKKSVYIGFHSNASNGDQRARGIRCFTNRRTDCADSTQLAGDINLFVNTLMSSYCFKRNCTWNNAEVGPSFGDYGEVSSLNLNSEMPGILVEAAFHDNVDDARLLRDYGARCVIAQGTLNALVKYFTVLSQHPIYPPSIPYFESVEASDAELLIKWGGANPKVTSSVLYKSNDGINFQKVMDLSRHRVTISHSASENPELYVIQNFNSAGSSFKSDSFAVFTPTVKRAQRVPTITLAYQRTKDTTARIGTGGKYFEHRIATLCTTPDQPIREMAVTATSAALTQTPFCFLHKTIYRH